MKKVNQSQRAYNLFSYLLGCFIILSYTSLNQWLPFLVLNSQIERVIMFMALGLTCAFIKSDKSYRTSRTLLFAALFLIWAFGAGMIRGLLIADCYWEYNQITIGIMSCSLPLLVYVFQYPSLQIRFYRKWIVWALPVFFLLFIWFTGFSQFYLTPLLFLGCFLPIIPREYRFFVIVILIGLGVKLESRAQVIKVALCIMMSAGYFLKKTIPVLIFKLTHALMFAMAIVLLGLGVSGRFNFFSEGLGSQKGTVEVKSHNKFNEGSEDIADDTRTFIYVEVIGSALRHNYVLCGRSLARGNDCYSWGEVTSKYRKPIRYMNEVNHPNVFTWLGVIGLVLYSAIYFVSSWLAVYRSRSKAMMLIGCFIAFHWLFGWIEDTNWYHISNITLWAVIAMGYSPMFRMMSDRGFRKWFRRLFPGVVRFAPKRKGFVK